MTTISNEQDAMAASPALPAARMSRMSKIGLVVLAITVAIPPFVVTPLELTKLSRLVVLVLAVLGVNLLTGYTGLISLGHGVFVGVGAFAMANLIDQGMSLFLAGFLATLFTGAVGLVLGLPALRVRGLYLALVTFGTALAFPPLLRRLGTWTGGVTGRTVDNDAFVPPSLLGLDDDVHIWRYGVCLAVVALWFVIIRNLVNSRMGRALRTVRDNEAAAATFGISVRYAKAGALAISAAMTGTAGVLQSLLNPYVSHADFDSFLSLRLYAAAVIGGLGTLAGVIFGVLALILIPTINGAFELLDSDAIVFGAGLIIMTFIAPTGIAGLFKGRDRGKSESP
ncbi:MAG: branched-chain amino acid ABC transporter permease [Acidimicrobiales bacterium]|jgi:branched-chain amino acid transport system permease protein